MRLLAYLANFIALVILSYFFYMERGWEYSSDRLGSTLLFAYIGINVIGLTCGPTSGGWFWLYFKRKRLEEKKKIEALEKKDGI